MEAERDVRRDVGQIPLRGAGGGQHAALGPRLAARFPRSERPRIALAPQRSLHVTAARALPLIPSWWNRRYSGRVGTAREVQTAGHGGRVTLTASIFPRVAASAPMTSTRGTQASGAYCVRHGPCECLAPRSSPSSAQISANLLDPLTSPP